MAFTSIAALVGGAEASAALVLGAITEVGVTMNVVGAVTGDKGLMKLGGVMGIIGGVGGLVNGAMGAAAEGASYGGASMAEQEAINAAGPIGTEAATGAATGAADAIASDGISFGGEAAPTAGMTTENLSSAVDEANKALGITKDSVGTGGDLSISGNNTKSIFEQAQANTGVDTKSLEIAPKTADVSSIDAPGYRKEYPGASDDYRATSFNNTNATPPKSFFDSFLTWAKEPKNANTLLQFGAGALKGMGDRSMWDDKMAQQDRELKTRFGYANQVPSFSYQRPSILQTARA